MSIFSIGAMLAAIVWQGESIPTTNTEAIDLGYVYLKQGDALSPRESSYNSNARWSDDRFPHADAMYFNAAGFILSPTTDGSTTYEAEGDANRTNMVFYGKRLVLANGKQFAPCGYGNSEHAPITTGEEGLFSAGGKGIINWSGNKACIKGPFTILNDEGVPFYVYSHPAENVHQDVYFYGDWRSRDVSRVVFTRNPVATSGVGSIHFHVTGEFDDFSGIVTVETNCELTVSSGIPNGTLQLGFEGYTGKETSGLAPFESGLNGKLKTAGQMGEDLLFKRIFSNGGTLSVPATNRWTVQTLDLNRGEIDIELGDASSLPRLAVTDSLNFVDKPVRLVLAGEVDLSVHQEWTVLSAPSGSILEGDFEISGVGLECRVVDDGQNARVMALSRRIVKSAAPVNYANGNNPYPTHFDSDKDSNGVILWEDGLAPMNSNIDYVLSHSGGFPCNDNALAPFRGHSLTLAENIVLSSGNNTPYACGLHVPDLRIENGVKMLIWSGSNRQGEQRYNKTTFRLQGAITVGEGAVANFNPYGDKFLRIESLLYGTGTIKLTTIDTVATDSAKAHHELTALNTSFKGRIHLTHPGLTKTDLVTPTKTICNRLYVADGRNLGGALDRFCYDAFRIDQLSVVFPTETAVAFDQANRGVYVQGCGRFDIPERHGIALKNPLTLNGELEKEGDGTLVLAGALRFAANDEVHERGLPQPGANIIRVLAGSLYPQATNSLDGAEVQMADGAALHYSLAPDGDGMREYGPVNTKWPSPFVKVEGAESQKIAVHLDATALNDDTPRQITVALGTFASRSLAEQLVSRFDCSSPWKGYRAVLSVRDNDNDTATIVCVVKKRGMVMVLR